MSSSADLDKLRGAVAKVSNPHEVNQDDWATAWCNTNWGDLLQPAPLCIALLSSLMVIASSANDFSLLEVTKNTPVELKYVDFPDSFQTCLQQMAGAGFKAFSTASNSMTRIENASSQLPKEIGLAVKLILGNSPAVEVEAELPGHLDTIRDLTKICVDAAKASHDGFMNLSALAQEILECATHKVGTAGRKKELNQMHITNLKEQKKREEQMVKEAKETSDLLKKSYKDAEEMFKTAVDNIPSGWEIMGMHVVESLTNTLTSGLNALLGTANTKGQYLQGNQSGGVGEQQQSTQPSGSSLSDPAIALALQFLVLVKGLDLLISGGSGGKPDWENIRSSGNKSGGSYIQVSLETVKDRLNGKKPISKELLPIVTRASEIVKVVNETANSVDSAGDKKDQAFDQFKPEVKKMFENVQDIVTRSNLILQQTGNVRDGIATPNTPQGTQNDTSAAKSAVDMSKFRVDQTRGHLQAALDAYDKASARLMDGQRELTKTIAEMTQLKLETATLEEIIRVLIKAVKGFGTLRAQFKQLSTFFSNVASLIDDVMRPQVEGLAKKIEAGSKLVLSGVSLSSFFRNALYVQMMTPFKVTMLANEISKTYLHVSKNYIDPPLQEVGNLLQFQTDETEEGKKAFLAQLTTAQHAIQDRCQDASKGIVALVDGDRKKYTKMIDQRLSAIETELKSTLPAIKEPVPKPIDDITKAHVKEFIEQKEKIAEAMPPYKGDPNDLL